MAGTDLPLASLVVLGFVCAALTGCEGRMSAAPAAAVAITALPRAGLTTSYLGADPGMAAPPLLRAASELKPHRVALPYAEIGGHLEHQPKALTLQFSGLEGQVLEIGLEQAVYEPEANGALPALATARASIARASSASLRVLIADDGIDGARYTELAAFGAPASEVYFRLPADADYVVHLRPPGAALYRLSLELRAPLPFPVRGFNHTAIRSRFGVSRDAGSRRHEGVDIFAPRRTPVQAVADGYVTVHTEGRGGTAVVLSIAGISYYYAHLDSAAVTAGERVRIGDVLGFVGSTGNARRSAPHLHFGVYRFGKGAIDPWPLLEARRFTPDALEPLLAAAPAEDAVEEPADATPNGSGRAGRGGGAPAVMASLASGAVEGCGGAGGASRAVAAAASYGGAALRDIDLAFVSEPRFAVLAPSGAAVLCTAGT